MVKNPPAKAGDSGSIPGSGRFPEKKMATTPVFLRGNPMDRGAWWATAHGVQTQLSTHTDNKSYKGHPGSWNWTWRGGSGFRLSTVLKAVSFCQSALLPLQADFPNGHTMAAMCLLIWICFCSAFQGRILRPTLIIESSLILFFSSIHIQSVKMVLPSDLIRHQQQVLFSHHLHYNHFCQPPTLPLDYWSHLLTGPRPCFCSSLSS